MIPRWVARILIALLLVSAGIGTAILTRGHWRSWFDKLEKAPPTTNAHTHPHGPEERVQPSEQAIANLGIEPEELKLQNYWHTNQGPGVVVARPGLSLRGPPAPLGQKSLSPLGGAALAYEVQQLKVELGQQIQAGQLMAYLANHHTLTIEGRAFAREITLLEQAARAGSQVEVEVLGDDSGVWLKEKQPLRVRFVSNMLDSSKRTLVFHVPLANVEDPVERDGRSYLLWRYR